MWKILPYDLWKCLYKHLRCINKEFLCHEICCNGIHLHIWRQIHRENPYKHLFCDTTNPNKLYGINIFIPSIVDCWLSIVNIRTNKKLRKWWEKNKTRERERGRVRGRPYRCANIRRNVRPKHRLPHLYPLYDHRPIHPSNRSIRS